VARATPPRRWEQSRARFRLTVSALHLGQPLVRLWGRYQNTAVPPPPGGAMPALAEPITVLGRRHVLFPAIRDRAGLAADLVAGLRAKGLRVLPPSAWDEVDATIVASTLVLGDLVTSDHPVGYQQLRLTSRLRLRRLVACAVALYVAVLVAWPLALAAVLFCLEIVRGWWKVERTAWAAILDGPPSAGADTSPDPGSETEPDAPRPDMAVLAFLPGELHVVQDPGADEKVVARWRQLSLTKPGVPHR
jgi:hypothetical protein